MTELTCPICRTGYITLHNFPEHARKDGHGYGCAACGTFFITRTAEITARHTKPDPRFSAWLRQQNENNFEPPFVTSNMLEEVVNNLPNYTPLEKQTILLRNIERKSEYPGYVVMINDWTDYPLAWAANSDEFKFLLDALQQRGLISNTDMTHFVISPKGWEYLDLQASKPAFSDQAFVAMSFNKEMDSVWTDGIKPAVESAGYKPMRVDKEPHIDRIDAKIIADIKDSLFIIADVTGQRQGVYFEAGFGLGLKRPVIWCVREDDKDNIHFDTRQYNHIIYKEPSDLQEELYNVICAVIGKRQKRS